MYSISEQQTNNFHAKYKIFNTCWIWQGNVDRYGYGTLYLNGKTVKAHRISYYLKYKYLTDGLVLDHLCRVRDCVNPAHLEEVTVSTNNKRGDCGKAVGQWQKNKTHCPQGHIYNEKNTVYRKNNSCLSGYARRCRICIKSYPHK